MVTVKTDKEFVFYSSIKELPMQRYKAMQNFLLQDIGIGNTMEDIDRRLASALMFAQNDKRQELQDELHNLRYSFFSLINGLDYKSRAFACLVAKIDGKATDDISDNGIEEINLALQSLTVGEMEKHWAEIKKNLIPN